MELPVGHINDTLTTTTKPVISHPKTVCYVVTSEKYYENNSKITNLEKSIFKKKQII